MKDSYIREITVSKIVDGDTLYVMCDLGFDVWKYIKIRLARINCPEKNTEKGKQVKDYMQQYIGKNGFIQSLKYDKYGRGLCEIIIDDINISDELIRLGHAVEWDGKGIKPI